MTPQDVPCPGSQGQEVTQVASRLRMFELPAPDRTNAAFAEHLLHLAEGGSLAGQGHRDIQRIGLRAEGHRARVLESGGAWAHFELNTDLRDLARLVGDSARFRTHFHDVL